jgi:hypothetical protein
MFGKTASNTGTPWVGIFEIRNWSVSMLGIVAVLVRVIFQRLVDPLMREKVDPLVALNVATGIQFPKARTSARLKDGRKEATSRLKLYCPSQKGLFGLFSM